VNIPSIGSFCPQESTTQRCSWVVHSSRIVAILNTETMHMRVCYLDCHEAGLCCYLVIHIETYYGHYSGFTSILTYLLSLPCIILPRHKNFPTYGLALLAIYSNAPGFPEFYQLLISSSMQFSFVTATNDYLI
jgi:hypothetical protein